MHRLATLAATALTIALAVSLLAAPAQAKPTSPKKFTGYGFDTCVSPSDQVMDAWNVASPYAVVGIYTSGNSRYCDDAKQPHLSPAWVKRQSSKGWTFLPIHVGYQAPCYSNTAKHRMSSDPAKARVQGRADADEAVDRARYFGFGRANAVYLDIEWYNRANTTCNEAVLSFIDAFTERTHARGYKVGLYSSASAAIQAVDVARMNGRAGMDYPDQMWFAWTNKAANTNGAPYLSDVGWRNNRIHQFHNNVTQRYGGQKYLIDKNFIDVAGGSKATKDRKLCGVALTQKSYPRVGPGKKGDSVKLLQCLLKRAGFKNTANGKWNRSTAKAVRKLHVSLGRKASAKVTRVTWTSLLARGSVGTVLKRGHTGERVYRLQRSLKAAGQTVTVTGIFDARTTSAVKAYRMKVGLPAYPTADAKVWSALKHGRR